MGFRTEYLNNLMIASKSTEVNVLSLVFFERTLDGVVEGGRQKSKDCHQKRSIAAQHRTIYCSRESQTWSSIDY